MRPGPECWRHLQKEYPQLSRVSQWLQQLQQTICDQPLRCLRQLHHAFVRLHTVAQLGRQEFHLHRMTRKDFRQLHIEQKSLWRFFRPTLHTCQRRQRVKCRIDFDEIEMLCVPVQSLFSSQTLWIPIRDKAGISPTRCAYADFTHRKNVAADVRRLHLIVGRSRKGMEPANKRNPSPLIPLPIGWGEGNRDRVHWTHAARFWSLGSSYVGCYSETKCPITAPTTVSSDF